MAWLQGRGPERHGRLISDNCIWPEGVAARDTDAILRLAGAEHFIPSERRTPEDEARLNLSRGTLRLQRASSFSQTLMTESRQQLTPDDLQEKLDSAKNAARKGVQQFLTPKALAAALALPLPRFRSIACDFTCGTGELLRGLDARTCLGSDIDSRVVNAAATMPHEIDRLIGTYLKDPFRVELNRDQVAPQSLIHHFQHTGLRDRLNILVEYLHEKEVSQALLAKLA